MCSVDTLDVRSSDTFQRFDKFNLKYNPIGSNTLRTVFLKQDNYMKGTYLAEITQQVTHNSTSQQEVPTHSSPAAATRLVLHAVCGGVVSGSRCWPT